VAGVRITSSSLTVPPTPPPDIDLEAWHQSIARIAAWSPARLAMTHFGATEDVDAQLSELGGRLDAWAQTARSGDLETFVQAITREIEQGTDPEMVAAFLQAAPPEQLYAGLERYWRKRADASSAQGLALS